MSGQTCTVRSISADDVCGKPAVERYMTGCVHEHIGEGWWCDWHAEVIPKRGSRCRECWAGPMPHFCMKRSIVAAPVGVEIPIR